MIEKIDLLKQTDSVFEFNIAIRKINELVDVVNSLLKTHPKAELEHDRSRKQSKDHDFPPKDFERRNF